MSNIREAKHTYNQLVAVLCDFVGSLNSFRIGLDVFWAVTFIAAPTEACSLRGDGAVDHVRSPPSTARKVLGENAPSARRVRASPTTPTVKNQSFGMPARFGASTSARITDQMPDSPTYRCSTVNWTATCQICVYYRRPSVRSG
ncbi:hypothetical protein MTP99_012528 [Tenebrio molitor]|jgi:hypothetical protein|nr:hypothetical protein MTP99_012528 [Tenebrio molitor]